MCLILKLRSVYYSDCAVASSAVMFDQSACGQPGPVLVATVPSTPLLLEDELHHLERAGPAGGGAPGRPDPGEPLPLPLPRLPPPASQQYLTE